jgi:phosphoglycerate dehydrogenase-like enzyme
MEPSGTAQTSSCITVAVLDVYPRPLRDLISDRLPPEWICRFADGYDRESQHSVLRGADVAFANWYGVDEAALTAAPGLRLIHKLGSGVDKIDQDGCKARGIALIRIAAGNATPVAEHTIMLMLAALRRLPEVDARTRAGEWFKEDARVLQRQLAGRRVGLLGLGAIGQAVARRLAGFEVELVYYDPVRHTAQYERELGVTYLDLDPLVKTADVVSLHLPLLPATRGLLSAERIETLKPGTVVVNCARGGLVDEDALARALREGRILAAGLDTFSQEPPVGSPLLKLSNTVVTAHVAGATFDNFGHMLDRAVANTLAVLRGEPVPAADLVLGLPDS